MDVDRQFAKLTLRGEGVRSADFARTGVLLRWQLLGSTQSSYFVLSDSRSLPSAESPVVLRPSPAE